MYNPCSLFANLTRPLYEVAVANYAYESTARNYLSLEPGDTVIVISHDGENNGWWKGRIGNRVSNSLDHPLNDRN